MSGLKELSDSVHNQNKTVAYQGLLVLLVISLLVAMTLFFLFSKVEAYSAVLGALAYILPNYCFTRFAFRVSAGDSAELALRWFLFGEAVKLLITALVIALCLKYITPLNMLAFFAMFMLSMVINIKFLLKNMTA